MLTTEQIALRRTGVGASEVAAVLGLDPYRTPFDVWAVKRGLTEERVSTPASGTPAERLGHLLEPVVADLYQMAHPAWVVRSAETVRHPVHEFALATPDRIVANHWDSEQVTDRHLLEIKTKSWRTARGFGAEGTDELPERILCQVQWQLAVVGCQRVDVAVLIDGRDYREYTVHADADLQATMLEQVGRFWREHVVAADPPELLGRSVADYLRDRFRLHSADVVPADEAAEAAMFRLVEVRAQLQGLALQEEELKNTLKLLIGTHKGVQGEAGRALWSLTRDAVRHDWSAIAQEFRTMLQLRGVPDDDLAAVVAARATTTAGSRRFTFSPAKGE